MGKLENGKMRYRRSGFLSAQYGSAGSKPADPGHPGRDAPGGLNDERGNYQSEIQAIGCGKMQSQEKGIFATKAPRHEGTQKMRL